MTNLSLIQENYQCRIALNLRSSLRISWLERRFYLIAFANLLGLMNFDVEGFCPCSLSLILNPMPSTRTVREPAYGERGTELSTVQSCAMRERWSSGIAIFCKEDLWEVPPKNTQQLRKRCRVWQRDTVWINSARVTQNQCCLENRILHDKVTPETRVLLKLPNQFTNQQNRWAICRRKIMMFGWLLKWCGASKMGRCSFEDSPKTSIAGRIQSAKKRKKRAAAGIWRPGFIEYTMPGLGGLCLCLSNS